MVGKELRLQFQEYSPLWPAPRFHQTSGLACLPHFKSRTKLWSICLYIGLGFRVLSTLAHVVFLGQLHVHIYLFVDLTVISMVSLFDGSCHSSALSSISVAAISSTSALQRWHHNASTIGWGAELQGHISYDNYQRVRDVSSAPGIDSISILHCPCHLASGHRQFHCCYLHCPSRIISCWFPTRSYLLSELFCLFWCNLTWFKGEYKFSLWLVSDHWNKFLS